MPTHLDTVRAYYDAQSRGDFATARTCVGTGYVWVDHGLGVVARSHQDFKRIVESDAEWSDWKWEIRRSFETTDASLIVQAKITKRLTGSWRSVEGHGQPIEYESCTIFRFNPDGLIVSEESYYDTFSWESQLGTT